MAEVRDEGTPEFQRWIDEGLARESDDRRDHAEYILNPKTVATLAGVLHTHVWMVFSTTPTLPFYSSDHPVALHSHVRHATRGYGLGSKGVEVEFPLSSRYLLSLVERTWLAESTPVLMARDGILAGALGSEHVTFQRSLQVGEARRFVYCSTDDLSLAAEMCETHPEMRDLNRNRVVAYYAGRPV